MADLARIAFDLQVRNRDELTNVLATADRRVLEITGLCARWEPLVSAAPACHASVQKTLRASLDASEAIRMLNARFHDWHFER